MYKFERLIFLRDIGLNMWIFEKTKILSQKISPLFLRYMAFGVLAIFFNLAFFYILLYLKIDYKSANLITIVLTKVFIYITNKFFVFRTKLASFIETAKEMLKFIMARLSTSVMDYFGLILLVEISSLDEKISKVIILIIITLVNYILSNKVVFSKNLNKETDQI